MSSRTTSSALARVRPVIDETSIRRSAGGRQIDWASVPASAPWLQSDGKKFIPAWTAVGDTLGSGKISPRVVTTNPAIGFIESDAKEDDLAAALSGYGLVTAGDLYENLLPDATGTGGSRALAAGIKTELGTTRWKFELYSDAR